MQRLDQEQALAHPARRNECRSPFHRPMADGGFKNKPPKRPRTCVGSPDDEPSPLRLSRPPFLYVDILAVPTRKIRREPVSFLSSDVLEQIEHRQESRSEAQLSKAVMIRHKLNSIVGDRNTVAVLLAIANGNLRFAEVARHMGVHRSTVKRLFDDWKAFIAENWKD